MEMRGEDNIYKCNKNIKLVRRGQVKPDLLTYTKREYVSQPFGCQSKDDYETHGGELTVSANVQKRIRQGALPAHR